MEKIVPTAFFIAFLAWFLFAHTWTHIAIGFGVLGAFVFWAYINHR